MLRVFNDVFLKKNNDISDTENIIEIGLWFMGVSEFFSLLTCRTKGYPKQYLLCDFIRIWQHKAGGSIND